MVNVVNVINGGNGVNAQMKEKIKIGSNQILLLPAKFKNYLEWPVIFGKIYIDPITPIDHIDHINTFIKCFSNHILKASAADG